MMTIRRATPEDVKGIASVQVETWQRSYRGFIDSACLDSMSKPEREERFLPLLTTKNKFCFVAENEDDVITGFVAGGPAHSGEGLYTHEIYSFYVHPSYQKKGIGKLLFMAALRYCKKQGAKGLLLWALKESPFRAFYEKMGGTAGQDGVFAMNGKEYNTIAYTWGTLPE